MEELAKLNLPGAVQPPLRHVLSPTARGTAARRHGDPSRLASPSPQRAVLSAPGVLDGGRASIGPFAPRVRSARRLAKDRAGKASIAQLHTLPSGRS